MQEDASREGDDKQLGTSSSASTPKHCRESEEATSSNSPKAAADKKDIFDVIKFSAGNPRVEQISGNIHLFRDVPRLDKPETAGPENHRDLTWSERVKSTAGASSGIIKLPVRFDACVNFNSQEPDETYIQIGNEP
eukprot:2508456-Pyramimonas_sp.AAC.1